MKIIITGATGLLGRNLAERFHDDGMEIVATGRSTIVGDELKKKGIEFKQADLRNINQLKDVFSPADCVIHCAGISGDWGKYNDFYMTNVVGTRHVIELCKSHDIKKIIFISTPSLYYTGEDRYNISERDPLPEKQITHYAKTKLIAEKELSVLKENGYHTIIFRPRAIYGPFDNTIIPRILRMADKKQFPLINNGEALTDITYVENLIDAIHKGLNTADQAWNDVYNISNGEPVTIRDWFRQVLEIFDRPFKPKNVPEAAAKWIAGINELISSLPMVRTKPSMTRFSVGYMAKSMTMAIDNAKQKLDYSPRFTNQQGFERYAKWHESNK